MANLGEEICGEYLKYILKCEFVTYNVTNPDIQGEIDVIGVNLEQKMIYICEVAVHTSGLNYNKSSKPDNYRRFKAKFEKDINYAKKYFGSYTIKPMIWSPVVKIQSDKAKYNTLGELNNVVKHINMKYRLDLELVINEKFQQAINELKEYTDKETSEFKSNVMRMFQIERSLEKHLQKLGKRGLLDGDSK